MTTTLVLGNGISNKVMIYSLIACRNIKNSICARLEIKIQYFKKYNYFKGFNVGIP